MNIEEKITSGKLSEITDKELEAIEEDSKLTKLLYDKLVELHLPLDELSYSFSEIAIKNIKGSMTYFLNHIFETNPGNIIYLIGLDDETLLSEFGEIPSSAKEEIIEFFYRHKKDLINYILTTKEPLSDEISTKEIIRLIIENKLYHHAGAISVDNPSKEIEDFICKAISQHDEITRLYTISKKILLTAIELSKFKLVAYLIRPDNEELINVVKNAIEEGKITYVDIVNVFQLNNIFQEIDHDYLIFYTKHQILTNRNPYIDSKMKDILKDNFELLGSICEELTTHNITIDMYTIEKIANVSDQTKIFLLKHLPSYFKKFIEDTYYIENKEDFIKEHELDLIDSLKAYLEDNQEKSFELTKKFIYKGFLEFALITSKYMSLDNLMELINEECYDPVIKRAKEEFLARLNTSNYFSFTKLPENIKLEDIKKLPESLLLKLIPVLSFEQLDPKYLPLEEFKDNELIINAIFKRLVELKSNKYNGHLWEINHRNYEEIYNAITNKDNPLNFTIEQINGYLNKLKTNKIEFLINIINTQEKISERDTEIILTYIKENIENNNTAKIDILLNEMFNKIPANKIYEKLKNQLPTSSKEVKEFYYSYLKTKNNVPIYISQMFDDEELISNSSLKDIEDEAFLTIDFLDGRLFKHDNLRAEAILKAINSNKKICFEVFYLAFKYYFNEKNNEVIQELMNFLNSENIIINYNENEIDSLYEMFNRVINEESIQIGGFEILFDKYLSSLPDNLFNKVVTNDYLTRLFTDKMKGTLRNKLNEILTNVNALYDVTRLKNIIYNLNDFSLLPKIVNKTHNPLQLLSLLSNDSENEYVIETIRLLFEKNLPQEGFKPFLEDYIFTNEKWLDFYIAKLEKDKHFDLINLELANKNTKFQQKVIELLKRKEFIYNVYSIQNIFNDINYIYAILSNEIENKNRLIKTLIEYLQHNEIKINLNVFNKVYDRILPIICEEFKLNNDGKINFTKFYRKYTEALKLLPEDNFIKLINLAPEDFDKIFTLIEPKQITISDITFINESLRQNVFPNEHPEVVSIFTTILGKIQTGLTKEDQEYYINLLIKCIPSEIIDSIKEINDEELLNKYKTNKTEFLKYLFIKVSENQGLYSEILRIVCNGYIRQKRNEAVKEYDCISDIGIDFYFEDKVLFEAILKLYLSDYSDKINLRKLLNALNKEKPLTKIDSYTLLFIKNPKDPQLSKLSDEELKNIKKNIGPLKEKIFELFRTELSSDIYYVKNDPTFLDSLPKSKRIPIIPSNENDIISIVGKIEIDNILELISNEKKYNAVLKALTKYKLLDWNNLFYKAIQKYSLGEGPVEYTNFLNFFDKIYAMEIEEYRKKVMDKAQIMLLQQKPKEEVERYIAEEMKKIKNGDVEISFTPFKILKYSTMFSSIANCYKIILGIEDFEHIRQNKGPNNSTVPTETRLEDTCNLAIKMIGETEVTIPSFIHEVNFPDGRKIHVIIGNKCNPVNLSHGERTGACMRSNGYCNYLFHLCAEDKRAFHITFVDPTNDTYLSRVSGFRNGNSLFLNELRCSVSTSFSNEDIVYAAQSASEEIIRRSKESTLPIENIVVSTDCAVSGHTSEVVPLKIGDFKLGVYEESYYNLSNTNAFVLATTAKKGSVAPIVLDADNQPVYEAVRTGRKEYSEKQINDNVKISIMRINAIKQCLEHREDSEYYKSIDIDPRIMFNDFKYLIIANDWYVALDYNFNIISECIEEDKRALEEYNTALKDIEEIKNNLIGGMAHGK